MEQKKSLSPEQAELLRRDLIDGATKFLETGSSIPEIRDSSRFQPTSLLTPIPKLLIEGPAKVTTTPEGPMMEQKSAPRKRRHRLSEPREASPTSDLDLSELSEAERQKFLKILDLSRLDDEDD
jgi:hypothetical protein